MRNRGLGLRTKFALFVVALISSIVTMLAVGLGTVTLNNQSESLARSLYDRSVILTQSISAEAASSVRNRSAIGELEDRVARISAMPGEAYYSTITGGPPRPNDWTSTEQLAEYDRIFDINYIYATNDPVAEEAIAGLRSGGGTGSDSGGSDSQDQGLPEAGSDSSDAGGLAIDAADRVPFGRSVTSRESRVEGYTSLQGQQFVGILDLLEDPVTELSRALADEINRRAGEELYDLERSIWDARQEQIENPSSENFSNLEELRDLRDRALTRIAGEVRAYPEFSILAFDPADEDFIFWYPLVDRDPVIFSKTLRTSPTAARPNGDPIELKDEELARARYVHGVVRVAVATDLIGQQLTAARADIIRVTVLIAALAVLAGIVGSIILARFVVRPIQRLVEGVEVISRTADKSRLEGHRVVVKSRDELFRLADTINSMTQGLVIAANEQKELIASSDMQKAFMPLDEAGEGDKKRKLTTAVMENQFVEFHGYYEGADALSGDYFHYEALDDRHIAVIKCDVAGHGILAAIIMVEVASIFLSAVRDWREKRRSINLKDLLIAMNELIEEREFKGRFAAMTVGILTIDNGRFRLCQGGDNTMHVYRAGQLRVEEVDLGNGGKKPATGQFPLSMFPPSAHFQEVYTDLGPGDIALLATDGIEESNRKLRDNDFNEIVVFSATDHGLPPEITVTEVRDEARGEIRRVEIEGLPETVTVNEVSEEVADPEAPGGKRSKFVRVDLREDITWSRIHEIVRAVHLKSSFTLKRYLDPNPEEELVFDYSNLETRAANVNLAIMAVEKIFRLVRHPAAGEQEMVKVDRMIDGFLRERFSLYNLYFSHPVPLEESPDPTRDEYLWFSHLLEEEQDDDLTILSIRKK